MEKYEEKGFSDLQVLKCIEGQEGGTICELKVLSFAIIISHVGYKEIKTGNIPGNIYPHLPSREHSHPAVSEAHILSPERICAIPSAKG